MKNIEHYLKPGAIVPVNNETTKALVDALKEAREALAGAEGERQPEQEPVIGTKTWFEDGKVVTQHLTAKDIYKDPEQPEQEPVAWESILRAVARGWCYEENAYKTMDSELAVAIAKEVHALYTTPKNNPQRTLEKPWVGLRDSQKLAIIRDCSHLSMAQLIELVEEEIRRNNNA